MKMRDIQEVGQNSESCWLALEWKGSLMLTLVAAV